MRSAKQLQALAAPTKPIRPKPRTPEQFERIYGPADYQAFTRAQPCACCGFVGATEICHARNGGKSRKADWTETFPGCGPHSEFAANRIGFVRAHEGCNNEPERIGRQTFEKKIGHTLLELAVQHHANYRAFLASKAGT